ncbi:MAG: cytochrome c oxidase subunit 3 [Gaiellaceae bacterium]
MSGLAQSETQYEVVESEPPELLGRNLNSAGHLLASATAFFFLAFVFAYFYLRSLNNAHLWRPKHIDPSATLGTLVMALAVASAVAVRLALRDQRASRRAAWRLKAAAGLALGIASVVLQVVEWTTVGFGPADGGYASVFVGWTAFNLLFVVGTMFWLENLLATAIRYRGIEVGAGPPAGHASGDPGRPGHDVADPIGLVRPGLEALSFYWAFLAGLGVLAWIILYLA